MKKGRLKIFIWFFQLSALGFLLVAGSAHSQTNAGTFLLRYEEEPTLEDYGVPLSIIQQVETMSPTSIEKLWAVYKPEIQNGITSSPLPEMLLVFRDDCLVGFVSDNNLSDSLRVPVFVLPVNWVCTTHRHHSRQHSAVLSVLATVTEHEGCTGWHLQVSKSVFTSALFRL